MVLFLKELQKETNMKESRGQPINGALKQAITK